MGGMRGTQSNKAEPHVFQEIHMYAQFSRTREPKIGSLQKYTMPKKGMPKRK